MIVGSLLLILVAIALLVAGLVQGTNAMLVASIAASLLAAIALVVGGRQAAGRGAGRAGKEHGGFGHPRPRTDDEFAASAEPHPTGEPYEETIVDDLRPHRSALREPVGAGVTAGAGSTAGGGSTVNALDETASIPRIRDEDHAGRSIPVQGDGGRRRYAAEAEADVDDDPDDDEPADEPAAQQVSPADAARVARSTTEVLVVDGRPRYHVRGCVHLLGRQSEPLPAGEAVELGFTPCAVCEPDNALLANARRS